MVYPTRHLDFDEWRHLANTNPEAFEAMRREVLQAAIERAPERRRQRLQALQWRVDQVRRRSSNPMAACISLSDMMWEAFAGDKGLLETLRGNARGTGDEPSEGTAVVILLQKPPKSPR
jgi:hypothetical protein